MYNGLGGQTKCFSLWFISLKCFCLHSIWQDLMHWSVWLEVNVWVKEESRLIFCCRSNDKKTMHIIKLVLDALWFFSHVWYTILRPPMYTHVTKAYSISKFAVAKWKQCINDTMYLIQIDLNIISAWSWKWCCLRISTKERCKFLVISVWTNGVVAQQFITHHGTFANVMVFKF